MKEAKRSTAVLRGQQFKTKISSDTRCRRDREKELQVEDRGGALSHSAAQFVSLPMHLHRSQYTVLSHGSLSLRNSASVNNKHVRNA